MKILVPISLPHLHSLLWWYNAIPYYHWHPDSPQIVPPEKFSCDLQTCTCHLHLVFNKCLLPNILKTKILKSFFQNLTYYFPASLNGHTILLIAQVWSSKFLFSSQICIYFLRNSILFFLLTISKYINRHLCFASHSYFVWIIGNAITLAVMNYLSIAMGCCSGNFSLSSRTRLSGRLSG